MPVDRPTFSESWYRVSELRPRLRGAVQIHRQHYRGEMWYVVQDPANNQFYRLTPAGHHFVGMLDGRRTVGQAWRACNEVLGDAAPTQGEAIQLLGQLYMANLLRAELSPDTESMFRRFRQRKAREVRGYLSNLLFIRFPLYDPDRFLDRWVGVVGWIFSPIGAALWVAMIAVGLYSLVGRFDELVAEGNAEKMLALGNLPLLYLSMAIIKLFHEFGHAFACKCFGRKNHSGGEVHVMGIMMLVFTPLPYVDASSSWALPSKWQRVTVGIAGMLVELFVAAIAAVVWSTTPAGTTTHTVAYNMMFIASISSLLFNGNPLLRFDGYYILSDLLEIPNLWQRSRDYLYYLVKKYPWGVRRPRCPSTAAGEKAWLVFYAIASTVYRLFIWVRILMYVATALPLLGMALAIMAVVTWILTPLGKFIQYLLANPELMRVRSRAVAVTVVTLGLIIGGITLIPAPNHVRADAVVRPQQQFIIHTRTDGWIDTYLPTGSRAGPDGVLLRCSNRELELQRDALEVDKRLLQVQRDQAMTRDLAEVRTIDESLRIVRNRLDRVQVELDRLVVLAPAEGVWVAPDLDHRNGEFLQRGTPVGVLVNVREPLVEAVVENEEADRLFAEIRDSVEMRLPGLPNVANPATGKPGPFTGVIVKRIPAGQTRLPSRALGVTGGGNIAIDPAREGESTRPFFTVLIRPDAGAPTLRPGQRVSVRMDLPDATLGAQWYRAIRQLIQVKFGN